MFREFNVKFEDVEIIGGSDNLLEGTEVTKVILRGDSKMSSLDSALKNCSELDTIDGDLDLNGVNDIDNLLEGTPLVKEISVKNVNVEDMSCDNSFTNINTLNIAGDSKKKAIQNLLGNMDWEFDGVNYTGDMVDVVTDKMEVLTDEECNIEVVDALEQKVRSLEIKGQTYKNLINGKEEKELVDNFITTVVDDNTSFEDTVERDLKIIEIQGNTLQNLIEGKDEVELIDDFRATVSDDNTSFDETYYTREVKISEIQGNTLQNLVDGKGKYTLTDTYNEAWTESNNVFENMPSMIEIPEIWGNTVQGFANCVSYNQIADCVNSLFNSNPKVFEDGLQGGDNAANVSTVLDAIANSENPIPITLKGNTTYSIYVEAYNLVGFITTRTNQLALLKQKSCTKFTTDSTGEIFIGYGLTYNNKFKIRIVEGDIDLTQYPFDYDSNYIESVGDLYVDEEGNEQYKLDITSFGVNLWDGKSALFGRMSKGVLESNDVWTENERVLDNEYGIGWTVKGSSMRGLTLDNILVEGNKPLYISFDYSHSEEVSIGSNNLWVSCFTRNGSYKNTVEGNMLYNSNGRVALITKKELDSDIGSVKICYYQSYHNENRSNDFTMKNIFVTQQSEDYVTFKPQQLNKTTILMPQPLRRVWSYYNNGTKTDKLYFDMQEGKYIIHSLTDEVKINISKSSFSENSSGLMSYSYRNNELYSEHQGYIISNIGCNGYTSNTEGAWIANKNVTINIAKDKFDLISEDFIDIHYIYGVYGTGYTIETKILQS